MKENFDWYPSDLEGERTLYANIAAKVDGYAGKYPHLTVDYRDAVKVMCQMFIEGFDKIEQNRATAKQMTTWFDNIVTSKQKGDAVPNAPVFKTFNIPPGATIGLKQQCRDFARLMKSQSNYEKADGLDLMIEKGEQTDFNLQDAVPEFKLSAAPDGTVTNEWKKSGFDMLEWQWRKAGTEMWQLADKSTEKVITFQPPLTTPGVPEKFEFRAVYILKNQRVGQWSPVYTLTVG